jgi:four helix bundle protein
MQTNYQNLKIWQIGFELTLKMYDVLAQLPPYESRNIADQMRRAATSLPTNIAEGASSMSTKVFINHLKYSYASAQELEVLLMLCVKLNYISEESFSRTLEDLDRFKRATFKFTANLERKAAQQKMGFLKLGLKGDAE